MEYIYIILGQTQITTLELNDQIAIAIKISRYTSFVLLSLSSCSLNLSDEAVVLALI
jgi:hypothetical protein